MGHLLYQIATEGQVNTFPWQSCDTDHQNFLWKAALGGKPPKLTWFVSLILRKCHSNQWAHKRHLRGNRQKAILKVKSILYRLPSTKEASVFIFHDLNASVCSNIYLIYLLLISKKLEKVRLLYNLKFTISKQMKMNALHIHCRIGQMAFLRTWTPVLALPNSKI